MVEKLQLSLVGMDAKNGCNRQRFGAVIFAKYLHLAVLGRQYICASMAIT